MKKVMISPSKYVQGENELCNLGEYVKAFGTKALLIASKDDQGRVQSLLDEDQKRADFTLRQAVSISNAVGLRSSA